MHSDVERQANEFMEENQPLLEDGSLSVVQRIFVQGAQIARSLSDETVDVANNLTAVTRSLAAAIRDPSTRPREIQDLETEREHLLPIYERKSAAFQRFSDFMDRVDEARSRRGLETGRE